MQQPRDPGLGRLSDPAGLTWLSRFTVCLREEAFLRLGQEWEADVDLATQTANAVRKADGATVSVPLQYGLSVVTPIWAARRIADQLQLQAVTAKYIQPPHGATL